MCGVKEQRLIDEMRAAMRGDRERALTRLQADGREPLFPTQALEERAVAAPTRLERTAEKPTGEPGAATTPSEPMADVAAAGPAAGVVEPEHAGGHSWIARARTIFGRS